MQFWVPATFWDDHTDRCPCNGDPREAMATEVKRSGNRVLIDGNDRQIDCLRRDAAYYADAEGPDECPTNIKRSAVAMLRALR